jgi:hypothetical protein
MGTRAGLRHEARRNSARSGRLGFQGHPALAGFATVVPNGVAPVPTVMSSSGMAGIARDVRRSSRGELPARPQDPNGPMVDGYLARVKAPKLQARGAWLAGGRKRRPRERRRQGARVRTASCHDLPVLSMLWPRSCQSPDDGPRSIDVTLTLISLRPQIPPCLDCRLRQHPMQAIGALAGCRGQLFEPRSRGRGGAEGLAPLWDH